MTAKSNQKSNEALSQAAQKQDPYGPYREQAALKLNNLMDNPNSINDTAEYKARQTAASRTMASQGYTGSGNALAAAAEAGGNSYQQAFNNLAMLSGAGVAPGQGAVQAAMGQSQNNQNAMNTYGQLANGLVGAGIQGYNNYRQNQAWNTPIDTGGSATVISQPSYAPVQVSDIPQTIPAVGL